MGQTAPAFAAEDAETMGVVDDQPGVVTLSQREDQW
jgi:hypothetical protein